MTEPSTLDIIITVSKVAGQLRDLLDKYGERIGNKVTAAQQVVDDQRDLIEENRTLLEENRNLSDTILRKDAAIQVRDAQIEGYVATVNDLKAQVASLRRLLVKNSNPHTQTNTAESPEPDPFADVAKTVETFASNIGKFFKSL